MFHTPATVGDYTDLYAGIHHAANVGRLFRPGNPLLPNYRRVPIGYHGRASSILPSGARVRRPQGQRKSQDRAEPSFGPASGSTTSWSATSGSAGPAMPWAQSGESCRPFADGPGQDARDGGERQ